jgi:hypothetical protein
LGQRLRNFAFRKTKKKQSLRGYIYWMRISGKGSSSVL